MRNLLVTTAVLTAILSQPLAAAPPVFYGESLPAAKKSGWWKPSLPSFLGGEPKKPVYQTPFAQQPTRTQRLRNAITNNAVVSAMTPGKGQPNKKPPVEDGLALSRPTGKPNAQLLLPLAAMAEQSGDIAAARGHFQRALALEPTNVAVLRQYGRLEDRQGRLDEAEKLYRQAVASEPQNPGALNDLALCFARQNRLQESVATLEQAILLSPTKPLYRNNIAKVLVELGDTQRAGEQLAAVHGPAIASYNLGQFLTASGRKSEAANMFDQALSIDPKLEPARVALKQVRPTPPAPAGPSPIGPSPAGPSPAATPSSPAAPPQLAALPPLPTLPSPPPTAAAPATPWPVAQPELPTLGSVSSPYGPTGADGPRLLPPVVE